MSTSPLRSITRDRSYIDELHKSGPGTLMGRYLRCFWQPVLRSIDLPVGKAKPITIMNERFTLYRGQSGTPYVVDHHCPHRGTQLSVGWVEGEDIRCLYHGWKFDGAGSCIERPGERGKGGAGIRIGHYPAAEFFGLIYVFFGEGEPPHFPPFPDFGEEGVVENYATILPVNWFQSWENDWDPYHARWTHRTGELHEIDYDLALDTERNEETDYGVRRTMEIGGGAVNTAILSFPATTQLLIPTFNGQNKETSGPAFRRTYLSHVPIDDHSHLAFISQLVPVTGEEAERYHAEYAEQEATMASMPLPRDVAGPILANGITTIEDVAAHPMLVEIEDSLAQGGQGTIANRHAEHLGRTDAGVVMLRRIMARELAAIESGKAPRRWAMQPLISLEGAYGQKPKAG